MKRSVTQAKRDYEKAICERSKDNPKVFWSHVRSKLSTVSNIPTLLHPETQTLKTEDDEKAHPTSIQQCIHQRTGRRPPILSTKMQQNY